MDEQTVTTGEYEGGYPPDDSEDTWHVHDDRSWAWGINCEVCHTPKEIPRSQGPYFNIHHLKRQNAEGTTTASEVKEVLENVKPENRDKIERAR